MSEFESLDRTIIDGPVVFTTPFYPDLSNNNGPLV